MRTIIEYANRRMNMRKTNILNLYVLFFFCLIILGMPSKGIPKEPPDLQNVTCSKWLTFEDDTADKLAHILGDQATTSKSCLEVVKSQARNQRVGYLTCLMDIYSSDRAIKFRDYEKEIDIYCSDPEHKADKIMDVFLIIDKKIRKSRK